MNGMPRIDFKACKRCRGDADLSGREEPFCIHCGHRPQWSNTPSLVSSSMGTLSPSQRTSGAIGDRIDRGGDGHPSSLGKVNQSKELRIPVWGETVLTFEYVQLTPRQACVEEVRFADGRKALTNEPTERYQALVRGALRDATGLTLTGLEQYINQAAS